jgi:hypothetical protein
MDWHFITPLKPSGDIFVGDPSSLTLLSLSFSASARIPAKYESRVFSGSAILPYTPLKDTDLAVISSGDFDGSDRSIFVGSTVEYVPVTEVAFCTPAFSRSSLKEPLSEPAPSLLARLYSPPSTVSGVASLCGPSSSTPPRPPNTNHAPTPSATTPAVTPMIRPVFFFGACGGTGAPG